MITAEYLRHCYFLLYEFVNEGLPIYCDNFIELKRYTFLSIYDVSKKFNRSSNDFIVINSDNKLLKVYAYYDIN